MSALRNPKPGIMEISPYIGGEAKIEGVTRFIRLASNENALGCSPLAKDAYLNHVNELHRYPDGSASALRDAISTTYNLNKDQIVCGAGSDELISLLIRAYAGVGDEVLYSRHGFLMYAIGAKAVGATPVYAEEQNLTADVDALLAKVTDKTKLLFLANPNNPTGSYLPAAEIKRLRENLPDHVLLVIDAAYAEFAESLPGYDSGAELVNTYGNVVMLRTFSKIYGLAGLRLGWGYFPADVADVINRVRGPFNVNAVAQIVGIAALSDHDFLQQSITHNTQWRAWLVEELQKLGINTQPSAGNFLLGDFGAEAENIRQALRNQGIFIRQMGAYGLPEHLRITVGLEEENKILCQTLTTILKN